MIDTKKIDWKQLLNPHPSLKVFKPEDANDPTDSFFTKVAQLQLMLRKRPLWISDELRTPQGIDAIINSYFGGYRFSTWYEYGDFQALVGFMSIHPEFKCEMTLKLIDKKIWGADFLRIMQNLVNLYIKEFKLRRVGIETMDKKIVKMAKIAGFEDEGKRPDYYKWNNKFYPRYILGKYGEKT